MNGPTKSWFWTAEFYRAGDLDPVQYTQQDGEHVVFSVPGGEYTSVRITRVELFTCSICGKSYQLGNSTKRRPRSGAQRFCGPGCRLEGKRRSTLASWHRNKAAG